MEQATIELTYQVVDEIKTSVTYKTLVKEKQSLDQNEEIKVLANTYQKAYEKYQEAKQYGRYHPDLQKRAKAFRDAKVTLYNHPIVIAYKEAEQKVQSMLDQYAKALANTISPHIQYKDF